MTLPRIAVALPDSMVYDAQHIRDKTEKLGYIARTLAIFQVTDIFIYHSPFITPQEAEREKRIIKNILGYLECPQYLRKQLFPIHRDLEFVGTLPPLATPHHMVDHKLKTGQFREALIYLHENKVVANVGTKRAIEVLNPPDGSLKDKKIRATVQIHFDQEASRFRAEIISKDLVRAERYWGYRIKFSDVSIAKFGSRLNDFFVIATDRQGRKYSQLVEDFKTGIIKIKPKNSFLFLFGEPKFDLYQMLKGFDRIKLKDISHTILNAVPYGGTRSIRLEEAVMISLSRILPILGVE